MRTLTLLHRWAGGLVGLVLAVLGSSGTLLIYKDAWLRWTLPGATPAGALGDAALVQSIAALTRDNTARSIVFPTDSLGVSIVSYGEGGGYADATGRVVARWTGEAERIETWLFDLHHHLLAGETGALVAGLVALAGIVFVVTGAILWWRTRAKFKLRVLPERMTRGAIVRHHRDLGMVVAPLLLVSLATGAVLTLEPLRDLVFTAGTKGAVVRAALAPPPIEGGELGTAPNWQQAIGTARKRYPDAAVRVLILPRQAGNLVTIRMRQPSEWLPNGRTMLWFDPATMVLVGTRDANALPTGIRAFNAVYPLHAAKVGGVLYPLVMTLVGLSLTMLGSFAVWSFWAKGPLKRARGGPIEKARVGGSLSTGSA